MSEGRSDHGDVSETPAPGIPPADAPGAETAPAETPGTPPPTTTFAWTPELAAGRSPDAPPPAPGPRHPVLDAIVWIGGLIGAIVVGGASVRLRTGDSAFTNPQNAGRLVGTVLGGFLIALVLWGLVVLATRRRARPRRLSSPIVPMLAVVVLLFALFGATPSSSPISAAAASPAPTASPTPGRRTLDQVLVIEQPYHLEVAPADESAAIVQLISQGDKTIFRSVDVRRILSGSTLIGYAVVADVNVSPGLEAIYLSQFERGVNESKPSTPPSHVTIRGRDVLAGITEDAGYAVWIEAPYLKIVFTIAPGDAQSVAQKFVIE